MEKHINQYERIHLVEFESSDLIDEKKEGDIKTVNINGCSSYSSFNIYLSFPITF